MDNPAPEILQKPNSRNNNFFILAGIIVLVLLLSILIYLGKLDLPFLQKQNATEKEEPEKVAKIQTSPLLSNQTALVRGTIVGKNNNEITVKGEKGQTDSFLLEEPVVIYKQTGTVSANLNLGSIELNKPAVITLELKNNKYKVISISYFIPPPPPRN